MPATLKTIVVETLARNLREIIELSDVQTRVARETIKRKAEALLYQLEHDGDQRVPPASSCRVDE